jgi:hypothetical protein
VVLPPSAQHARSSSHISVEAREDPVTYSLRKTLIMWDRTGQPGMLDIPWLDWEAMNTSPRELGLGVRRIISNPFWQSFDRFRHTNAYFNVSGRILRDFFPETPTGFRANDFGTDELLQIQNNAIVSSMTTAMISLVGRRLITTTHGYLGLAPAAVKAGDVVAIVYGCSFPVVLRPHGEMYQVIGESYIDGIMDGELTEAEEREKLPEVDFTFC